MKFRIFLNEAFLKNNPQSPTSIDVLEIESSQHEDACIVLVRTMPQQREANHTGRSGFKTTDILKIEPII